MGAASGVGSGTLVHSMAMAGLAARLGFQGTGVVECFRICQGGAWYGPEVREAHPREAGTYPSCVALQSPCC